MKNNGQAGGNAAARGYEAPVCEIFGVSVQRVICDSETEKVGEDEGEW